jgi:glutathione S-transferase
MKLYARPASPFARKVRVMIIETGLADKIEIEMLSTIEEVQNMPPARNPLGKIPALELDSREALFDSPVICEYLVGIHDAAPLLPKDGWARWHALRLQAAGDGIGDAAAAMGAEGMRPEDKRLSRALENQWKKITRTTGLLNDNMDWLDGPLNIGQIAVATSLGYADFRLDDYQWRDERPNLEAWFAEFNERASMQETFFARPSS